MKRCLSIHTDFKVFRSLKRTIGTLVKNLELNWDFFGYEFVSFCLCNKYGQKMLMGIVVLDFQL